MENYITWTRKQFEALPEVGWDQTIVCDNIVIVPAKVRPLNWMKLQLKTRIAELIAKVGIKTEKPDPSETGYLHDSGFVCLGFVAVVEGKPTWFLGGGSDVIHYDGIGGYGFRWLDRPQMDRVEKFVAVAPSGWIVDYLPVSGFFRFWPSHGKIICGPALSSFEVYRVTEEKSEEMTLKDLMEDLEKK